MGRRTQPERRAETRRRLLAAAAALFAERGVDAVPVDEVAARADRTSGALYAHFGSKQGLLRALLDSWKDVPTALASADIALARDVPARLRAMWRYVATPHDDAGRRWLVLEHELWLRAARDPAMRAALAERYAEIRAAMAPGLTAGRDTRAAAETAVLALALLFGLEMQHRLDPHAVPERLAVDGLARLLAAAEPATDGTDSQDRTNSEDRTDREDSAREGAGHAHRTV